MSELWDTVKQNRPVAMLSIVSVSLLVGVSIFLGLGGTGKRPTSPPRKSQAYFWDLNKRELFTADADLLGPIDTDSGDFEGHPAGVRAVVFSCGSCNDPEARFVAWLEMPGKDANDTSSPGEDNEGPGPLIRDVNGDKWHSSESTEAGAIMDQAQTRCGEDGRLRYCHPRSKLEN